MYMSPEMESAIEKWRALEGAGGLTPSWCDGTIRTVRFSNTVARELARLITQSIDIKVETDRGDGRTAKAMQAALDGEFLQQAQETMEKVIRMGGVMAKWNGAGIDYLTPDRFLITNYDSNGKITGAIFFSSYTKGKTIYTRAEYHRFEEVDEGVRHYKISNRAFASDNVNTLGGAVELSKTKWADIEPEVEIASLEKPLFAYLKNPFSNTVDQDSPLGVSLFSDCMEELRWLDIAMSTLGTETENSTPVMFVDDAAVMYASNRGIRLPKFIRGMQSGIDPNKTVQQWQPTLQVASRKEGINFYLSIISYKCGFDAGYFVFDGQKIEAATATQVEATERRTVNTVLSFRNLLDRPDSNGDGRIGFVHDLAFMINAMQAAAGEIAPVEYGNYTLYCDFADLTENREENKAFDYQLTQNGYMSKVRFLVRNLGLTEQEAQEMVAEAKAETGTQGLFGSEGI